MKHIAQFVHSLQIGGAEVLAANIACALKRKGYKCSVWGMAAGSELLPRLHESEINSTVFNCPSGISIKTMASIACCIVRDRVDCVVTHHFRQLFHAIPAVVLLNKRLIHIEHDYHFYESSPRHLPLLRFLLRFTSQFVAVSQGVASAFESGLAGRVRCIPVPNGIDISHFRRKNEIRSRMRQAHGFNNNYLVIGTCARLEPVKQVELLIKGFAELAATNEYARLVIVGDGSEHNNLASLTDSLAISSKVIFAGISSNICDYLNMFDIFALTSSNEGLPLALLEAMSVELPVVATDVGSVSSVVGPQTGILLEYQTAKNVARAFYALEDAAIRSCLGKAARQLIEAKYSQDSMVRTYIEILKNLHFYPAGISERTGC